MPSLTARPFSTASITKFFQERYPEGHPKGGQFKPKDADDEGDRIEGGDTEAAKSGTTNQDSDDAFEEGNYRPSVVNWAKERFGDRVAPNGKPVYQNFAQWFGNSQVVDSEGRPRILFHGTTRDFTGHFSPGASAVESDLGAGIYLSSSAKDAGLNYGNPLGPDVRNRIEQLAEQIDSAEYDGSYDQAREEAEANILENRGLVIPAMVRMENPVVLGRDVYGVTPDKQTQFNYKVHYDDDGDVVQESGSLLDLVAALRDVPQKFDVAEFDLEMAVDALVEHARDYDSVSADSAVSIIKDKLQYAYDDMGRLANSEIVRSVFEQMGFDGIIDRTVRDKFRGMPNLPSGTAHYIAFGSSQIKSPQNKGDFSDDPRILFSNAGEQKRYPEGHPKGGQFMPKDATDEGDTIEKDDSAPAGKMPWDDLEETGSYEVPVPPKVSKGFKEGDYVMVASPGGIDHMGVIRRVDDSDMGGDKQRYDVEVIKPMGSFVWQQGDTRNLVADQFLFPLDSPRDDGGTPRNILGEGGLAPTLSAYEYQALNHYSAGGYQVLNAVLRGEAAMDASTRSSDGKGATQISTNQKMIARNMQQHLDSAMKRNSLEAQGVQKDLYMPGGTDEVVWRGTSTKSLGLNSWRELEVGQVLKNHGYPSASQDANIAERFVQSGPKELEEDKFIMHITTENGHGVRMDHISNFGEEKEVLLPRESRFEVVAVHEPGSEGAKQFTSDERIPIAEVRHYDPYGYSADEMPTVTHTSKGPVEQG